LTRKGDAGGGRTPFLGKVAEKKRQSGKGCQERDNVSERGAQRSKVFRGIELPERKEKRQTIRRALRIANGGYLE